MNMCGSKFDDLDEETLHFFNEPVQSSSPDPKEVTSEPATGSKDIERHENELRRLSKIARDMGFMPSNDYLYKVPEDERRDEEFFYGVPPFKPDGKVNPEGIPDRPADDWTRKPPDGFSLLPKEYKTWFCRKCNRPQKNGYEYSGPNEPEWWWWCMKCREDNKVNNSSKKRKALDDLKPGQKTVKSFFARI